jgi:integrase
MASVTSLEPLPRHLPEQHDPDRALSAATVTRITESVPANTARAYAADRSAFTAWCATQGRSPLPCTPETLAEYVNHLATPTEDHKAKAPKTIERALTSIRTMHDVAGHPLPTLKLARAALKQYKNTRADEGHRLKKASPITVNDLRAMVEHLPPDTAIGIRDRALIILGWAMMARRSELAALRINEVTETPDGIEVWVRKSKTDRGADGESVAIPYGSNPDTCPVRLTRAWINHLAGLGITSGQLWRSIDRYGTLAGQPNFAGRATTPALTDKAVSVILLRAARLAALPNLAAITAHSLRSGGATGARRAGADMLAITRHGRWSDGSRAAMGYIQEADKWANNPMRGSGL